MKAILLSAPQTASLVNIADPVCSDDEVLVRIEATGLCGSDVSTWLGQHPFRRPPVVLGHEAAGIVTSVGRHVDSVAVGQRIALCPLIPCRRCDQCLAGRINRCRARRVPGLGWSGTYADYIPAPPEVLFPVDRETSAIRAALIEPAAVAVRACRRGGVSPGTRVAILGAGGIGSMCALVSRASGARTILVSDVSKPKLDRLGACLDFTPALVPSEDLLDVGSKLTGHRGFDVVIVAATSQALMGQAIEMARPGGSVILVALADLSIPTPFDVAVVREVSIRGSYVYDLRDFEAARDLVVDGRLPVDNLVTHVLPMAEAPRIFEQIQTGLDYTKIIFTNED